MACRFAFDSEDVNCATCDGVTMKIGEQTVPCTKCPGYCEYTEQTENTVQETVEDTSKNSNEIAQEKTETVTESVQDENKTIVDEYVSKAKTKTLKFMSGVSVEKDNVWYKFECTQEVEFEGNDVDIEKEKKILWDKVNNEVDNQVELLFK